MSDYDSGCSYSLRTRTGTKKKSYDETKRRRTGRRSALEKILSNNSGRKSQDKVNNSKSSSGKKKGSRKKRKKASLDSFTSEPINRTYSVEKLSDPTELTKDQRGNESFFNMSGVVVSSTFIQNTNLNPSVGIKADVSNENVVSTTSNMHLDTVVKAETAAGKVTKKKALTKRGSKGKFVNKQFVSSKMPNFALIHQKADSKTLNLVDYVSQKRERAQILLSGMKPSASKVPKTPEAQPKKSKKQLHFANTPSKQLPLQDDFSTPVKSAIPLSRKATPAVKVSVSLRGKENNSTIGNNGLKKIETKSVGIAGVKRLDIKKPEKTLSKEELIDKVKKNVVAKVNVEKRREIIKGVRSNRRFDLLMKMRGK